MLSGLSFRIPESKEFVYKQMQKVHKDVLTLQVELICF